MAAACPCTLSARGWQVECTHGRFIAKFEHKYIMFGFVLRVESDRFGRRKNGQLVYKLAICSQLNCSMFHLTYRKKPITYGHGQSICRPCESGVKTAKCYAYEGDFLFP
jgi:hypothetical protein